MNSPPLPTLAPNTEIDNFLFIYELDPSLACTNFRYDSNQYGQANNPLTCQFSVWQEMLAVTYNAEKELYYFDSISEHAHSTVASIVAGYAFFTGKPLKFSRRNWIQYQGSLKKLVIGKFENYVAPILGHADNKPFKELNRIMHLILSNTALAGALKDFYSCSSRTDPDFYFAYRATEDIRSHFVSPEDEEETKPSWDRMNEALGRKEQDYATLKNLATQSRHRNILGESIVQDTANKAVRLAHSLIADFIKYLEIKEQTAKDTISRPTKFDSSQKPKEPTAT